MDAGRQGKWIFFSSFILFMVVILAFNFLPNAPEYLVPGASILMIISLIFYIGLRNPKQEESRKDSEFRQPPSIRKPIRKMYVVGYYDDGYREFYSRKKAMEYAEQESKYREIEVYEVNADHYCVFDDFGHDFGIIRKWVFHAREKRKK